MIKKMFILSIAALMAMLTVVAFAQSQESRDCLKGSLVTKKDGTQWLRLTDNCSHNATEFNVNVKYSSTEGYKILDAYIPRSAFNEKDGRRYWESQLEGSNVKIESVISNHPKTNSAEAIEAPMDNSPDEVWMRYYKATAVIKKGETRHLKKYGECTIAIVPLMASRHCFSGIADHQRPVDPENKIVYMTQMAYETLPKGNFENNLRRTVTNKVNKVQKNNRKR